MFPDVVKIKNTATRKKEIAEITSEHERVLSVIKRFYEEQIQLYRSIYD